MSMNRVSGFGPVYDRAERPVAVRAVVHGNPREGIPLAEQHRVVFVPLGVAHVERRRAEQLQAAGDADGERRRTSAVRATACAGENSSARNAAEHGGQQHDAGRAEAVEQRQQQQTAGRGADQIGSIDDVDLACSVA